MFMKKKVTKHLYDVCRSDEKLACVAICDRFGLKGYQVLKPEIIYNHRGGKMGAVG